MAITGDGRNKDKTCAAQKSALDACVCGLNDLCASLKNNGNQEAFLEDEKEYCSAYDLSPAQQAAIFRRDLPALIAAGAAPDHVAHLARLWDISADARDGVKNGMSVDAFRAKLLADSNRAV